jgi:hypothetical protein
MHFSFIAYNGLIREDVNGNDVGTENLPRILRFRFQIPLLGFRIRYRHKGNAYGQGENYGNCHDNMYLIILNHAFTPLNFSRRIRR